MSNNPNNGASSNNQKGPMIGPSLMMGAAHGNLAGPMSPQNDAKLVSTNAVGFTSVPSDEKGFNNNGPSTGSNALGIGGAGRLGLD